MEPIRRRPRRVVLLAAALAVALAVLAWPFARQLVADARDPALPPLVAALRAVAPLHPPKRPPQPGEWLDRFSEPGQSFAAYRRARPHGLGPERRALCLRRIGFEREGDQALAEVGAFLARFYGLPVRTLEAWPLARVPADARRIEPVDRLQLRSTWLLDALAPEVPADAAALLALTDVDLWPGDGWNFVFGQASLVERVGCWSVARLWESPDRLLRLRRTLKVAAHETGHMLGILHCTAHECGMNGANHVAETDASPLWFCGECDAKIWWACGVDPAARYSALADFAETHGLAAERDHWRAASAAVSASPR